MKHKTGTMELDEWRQRLPLVGERFEAFAEGQAMVAIITGVRRIRLAGVDKLRPGDGTHLVTFDLRPDLLPTRRPPPWITGVNGLNRSGVE